MIERRKQTEIAELLSTAPSVAILGPRQVGKTTLALALADQRPSLYLDLQSEADQIKLADPGYYLRQHADKLIVLDEIHRAPGIFSALRWTMLAHLHGGLMNASQLARNLDVDSKTVATYLDLLVDLLLVRRLPPWHANVGKRLVKSPKIYLRDTGVLHTLLQIPTLDALLGHPKLGDSWEGFAIENIAAALKGLARPYFYRTAAGAEIDLILDFGSEIWAIEIKRNATPRLSKGFYIACDDLNPSRRMVVHGGKETFRLEGGIEAISLGDLMREISA